MINVTVCDKNSRRRIVINYVADSSIIIQDSNSSKLVNRFSFGIRKIPI